MVPVSMQSTVVHNIHRELAFRYDQKHSFERGREDSMPLSNLHEVGIEGNDLESQVARCGGEDTAHLTFWCDWVGLDSVRAQLAELKGKAQKGQDGSGLVNGLDVVVRPTGVHKGGHFDWVLEIQGCSILLGKREESEGNFPNVMVNLGSLFLHKNGGLWVSYVKAVEWLKCLGWMPKLHKLSRVDVCIDIVGVGVSNFYSRVVQGKVICRAVGARENGKVKCGDDPDEIEYSAHRTRSQVNSFSIGQSPKLRIYDKRLESKTQPEKLEFFEEYLWGGDKSSPVTRVEFAMTRDDLKVRGIDNVPDWIKKRASIIHDMCHRWCRITDGHDKRHTERAVVCEAWRQVQAIAAVLFEGIVDDIRCVRPAVAGAETLVLQAVGCLTSALARLGIHTDETNVCKSMLYKLFFEALRKHRFGDLMDKYIKKCAAYRGKVPILD
jgi:hypothetical protein